jgi:hypothetical protein
MAETYYSEVVAHLNDEFLTAQRRFNLVKQLQVEGDDLNASETAAIIAKIGSHCAACAEFEGNAMTFDTIQIAHEGTKLQDPPGCTQAKAHLVSEFPDLADVDYASVYNNEVLKILTVTLTETNIEVKVPGGTTQQPIIDALNAFIDAR